MQTTPPVAKTRRLAMAALFSLLLSSGMAQQTANPSAQNNATNPTAGEETVILSPFVVDAAEDQGYRATSTLAGSRIKTDLRDVAAPITVVTKEFLNDVAATDINDVLAYTANTEGTRDFTASTSSLGRPTDDIAANSFSANRFRGLEQPESYRDYFFTINDWIGFDTYNLDQVTISRGPNSVLAGLGKASGIINYSPQLANLNRNRSLLSFRFGSYGDKRAVLNTNYVVKPDVLGVRVAGLWADQGFKQEPAYRRDKRIYLTTTYQPWKQTTIRASYEYAKVKANMPNSLTPEDDITEWLARGSPSYDSSLTGDTIPDPLSAGADKPVAVFDAGGTLEGWWNANSRASYFQANLNGVGIWSPLRMNDNRYLDIDSINLNPSLDDRDFDAINLSIDQQIAKGLFANVAYVHETANATRLNLFRSEYASYMIDPNVLLPNGAPNPHYGETYMEYRGLDNHGKDHNTNEAIRATVNYELDLRESNTWLGHYKLTGFIEDRETETHGRQWNAKVATDLDYEDMSQRFYLGGSGTARASTVPGNPGLLQDVPGIPPGFPATRSGAATISSIYALKSDRKNLQKLSSAAFIAQAYLWDDRIVGMYGYRRDTNKGANALGEDLGNNIVGPAGDYDRDALRDSKFTQGTHTYGVVVHALSWLSLHYNKSGNFQPNAGQVDLDGIPTPAPTGSGKDYGFSLDLLDNKLNVKVNWFELEAKGANAESVTFPLNQWTIPFLELTIMPDIASTPAFQAAHPGFVYQKRMADGLVTGDTRLNGAYAFDQVSKGIELELTYNVTKNWRLMGSVSKQEAKQSNIAGNLTEFIEDRLAYWQSSGLFDFLVSPGGGWGQNLTGREYWERDSLGAYITYRSGDGRPSTQMAKWHASALTTYTFTEGGLKGFYLGGGARYIEGSVIGLPAILDAEGRVSALDLDHPYRNSSYVGVDAWVGYRTKVFADRFDLNVQLNIKDLQESGHYRPITANSDGTHSAYRIMQPRTFYLNTTLEF